MDGHIRRATEEDIPLLAALIRTSHKDVAIRFNLKAKKCPTHPAFCTDEMIKKSAAKGEEFYILMDESRAVGCVALLRANRDVFYMERLAVLPEYRSCGCGSLLANFCIQLARKRAARRVVVGVIADQTELIEWHRWLGFRFKQYARFPDLPYSVAFMYNDLLLQEELFFEAEAA